MVPTRCHEEPASGPAAQHTSNASSSCSRSTARSSPRDCSPSTRRRRRRSKQLALAMSSQKAPTISIFDSLERQKLKQHAQVPFVPSRHDLRQQSLARTFLQGRAGKVWAWIYLKATDRPARRPFVPERELYRTCQSLKKDRKRSISAATSYNPSI